MPMNRKILSLVCSGVPDFEVLQDRSTDEFSQDRIVGDQADIERQKPLQKRQ
jgi:hypothetical protein